MSTLLRDLVCAIRQFWRQPLFAACAVLTLAIGMGVNAVAFTVVNGVLFKGAGTSDADGVGRIATSARRPGAPGPSITVPPRFARSESMSRSLRPARSGLPQPITAPGLDFPLAEGLQGGRG